MSSEALVALVGAAGLVSGALITSVLGSRSSESGRLQALVIERDKEITALRKVVDQRHTCLSAYARTLEIVCLAFHLPIEEQIEAIREARNGLAKALSRSGGSRGDGGA